MPCENPSLRHSRLYQLTHRVTARSRETRDAADIGRLVKVPVGVLARCTRAYAKALALDPERHEEAEHQRQEARNLRLQLPDGPGFG